MKILFIYPNVAHARSPQVGLSSLAGTLHDGGHECRLLDITFMNDEEVPGAYRSLLMRFKPDLIGVSARSTEWETAQTILRMADPGVPVVAGGPHPTIAPEEVIADERVDMLVRGEGEESIAELVSRIESGTDLRDMPNLWVKQDGEIHRNDVRPLVQDMDSLAFPDWNIWDERHFREHYQQIFSPEARMFGDLETSRGCPYSCPYCLTPVMKKIYKGKGKYHREKSAGRIIAEVEKFRQDKGIDYVRFVDETFILNKKRLREFCELYKRDFGMPFSFSTRPETVNEEMMRLLSDAGARAVSFGLESGNEEYRREMLNRRTKQVEVINAVALAKKYDVKTFAFVMIGLPHEDRDKIQDTLELINLLQPDVYQITIFYPFEGTPFYDYCLDEGLITRDHERLTEIWKGSVLNQPHLPSDYLVRLRELMLAFGKLDKRTWPLMYYLEKHPRAFKVWQSARIGKDLAARVPRKLGKVINSRRGGGEKTASAG